MLDTTIENPENENVASLRGCSPGREETDSRAKNLETETFHC